MAILVLARLALGIPLLGALGGRAGRQVPAFPAGVFEASVLAAGGVAGFVAAWIAPDRPVLHALALALAAWGLWSAGALFGPAGDSGALLPLALLVAVVAGGWGRTLLASERDRPPEDGRRQEGAGQP